MAMNNDLGAGTRDISVQSISRWRRAAAVLFACRRFSQTLHLKKEGEKEQASSKVHADAAIPAEHAFEIEAGEEAIVTSTTGDFGIGQEELVALTKNDEIKKLESSLKTNLEDGINGEDADVLKRKSVFGENTDAPEKSTSFLTFLWEASQDISLMIIFIAAVTSSVMSLVTKGTRFGYWEEGGSAVVVVTVNIIVKAICKYSQSQLYNVKEERRNLYSKVIRGGKQVKVSICDIVVGNVIPLNIGDQVPAYGILITAQSLAIDTSRVNGYSNIVTPHASSGACRLKSGWKIADGSGTMRVTSVGICTKKELSQDIGNKTTLEEVLSAVPTSFGNVGLAVAFIAVMVLLLRWFTGHNLGGSPKFTGVKTKPRDVIEEVNQIIISAFTIAVAAVPQGLPLAVTLTIVGATKRMVADNAFVRRPFACGPMAFAKNLICDKMNLNKDLCQSGVKEKVQLCQGDGVEVRMVTGDNLPTAKAIALECGILVSDEDATTPNLFDGREFHKLTDGERQGIAQRIKVMACSSPEVKLLFVQALKKSTEMVADDAHGLHQADIGLAMGIQGTEVAKENSDIIILDDSFSTCVKAFKWARSVHVKFMQLQLTVNVVALTTNFIAVVFYVHAPFNAVQLLWVNLLIVALVPLSLVIEPLPDEVMQELLVESGQPPKKYINWTRLGFQSVYQIGAILLINFQGKNLLKSEGYNDTSGHHATKVKDTMIFNAFVVCQIIHQLEAQKKGILSKLKKWIASNYRFLGIVGIILMSQFIITEFLGKVFSTVALNQKE